MLSQLIDARLVALGIPAVCVLIGAQIRIASASTGAGSSVTLAPPSAGTYLITAITGNTITIQNTSITTSYGYYEVGLPTQFASQFTFVTVPPAGAVMEFLLALS